MSEKIKFGRREWTVILLAALLVVTPLVTRVVEQFLGTSWRDGSDPNRIQHAQEIQGWLTLLVASLTLVVVIFQAFIYVRQTGLMEGQLSAAKTAAIAAETAANAALASLDRPWLFIGGLKNTRNDWMIGSGGLTAELHITNYGKAPAVIASVNAVLFLTYENLSNAPYAGERAGQSALKFPNAEDLNLFLMQRASWPLVDVSNDPDLIPSILQEPHSGPMTFTKPVWSLKRFDSPVALSNGDNSETFGWRQSILSTDADADIAEDGEASVFLIGQIIYFGPTIGTEVMTFSYKASRFGTFQMYGGAPYNERRKSPDMPSNLMF